MTDLWLMLLVKSTIVLAAGACLAQCLRRRSAAARHLVWLSTISVLLLLPLGLLIPQTAVPVQLQLRQSTSAVPMNDTAGANRVPSLTTIWAVGAGLLLLRLGFAAWTAARLVRSARSAGNTAGYAVRIAQDRRGPLAWSFGRGTVVLPASADGWHKEALEAALLHEGAHLTRRDCQALLVAELACALYWFHPLIWYALRRLRIEQEHAADDAVLQSGMHPADYAHHLVELARFGRTEPLLAGAGTASTLTARVTTILDERRNRAVQNRRMVLVSIAAIVVAAIPLAALQSDRKVYRITDDGVTPPQVLVKQEPAYTEAAREAKIQGSVVVSAVIEPDGRLSNIEIVDGLELGLNESAITALHSWVFKPAEKNGSPVAVSCKIEINFRLL